MNNIIDWHGLYIREVYCCCTPGAGEKEGDGGTYFAATDMPVYNTIDPDTLRVTGRTDLLLNFGRCSALEIKMSQDERSFAFKFLSAGFQL